MKKIQMKHGIFALTGALTAVLATLLSDPLPMKAAETDGAQTSPAVIVSFEALPSEQSVLIYETKPSAEEIAAALPVSLSVILEGAAAPTAIPVTWQCGDDYNNTSLASYTYTPQWDTTAYTLSPALDAAQLPPVTVMVNAVRSTICLMAPEKAKSELDTLAQSKTILALVYLSDAYEVKKAPGITAETLLTVDSGQSVQITGVAEDALRNIWYQVSLNSSDASSVGYVERSHLAYSDEDLLAWEHRYISSYLLRSAHSDNADPYADISAFPSSYQEVLKTLKDAHPGWIFVKMDTGLDWSDAVRSENSEQRSLISSTVNAAWKTGAYDSSWAYPTDGILSYYMDPRNFLTDTAVFQFELLSYNSTYHTQAIVQSMLDSTFMSGLIPGDEKTYAEEFFRIGQTKNVSPFHLAARVRVEQGQGTSPLISGQYPGYEGVYNYFNIGASGRGSEAITNGLEYAKTKSWNTRCLSLEGGAQILSQNYINKGQDTLYLQKFNVNTTSASGAYMHQYMQNIMAPSTEASIIRKSYTNAGVIDKPFVFKIPIYHNMPGSACSKPTELNEVTLDKTSVTLKTGATAFLTAFVNGTGVDASSVSFTSSNPAAASVDAGGTVTAVSPGTADISCTRSGGTTAVCRVTVQKTEPAYEIPTLGAITYDPAVTLAGVKLPSGWAWDIPSTVPTAAVSAYPATFTPADTVNYHTVKKQLSLTVQKQMPAYTLPAGLQTVAGNTLASLKLPAGFTWEEPSTVLTETGTVSCKASYNPDTVNYNTVTGIGIPVTVNAKAPACTTGHTFGEWVPAAAAGCTTEGADIRSCHICGYQETRTFPVLGHAYTAAVTKEASETETGVRTYTCARCGHSYTEAIDKLPPSHTHGYAAAVTREASCTEKGVKTYSCSCGDSYTEDIPPSGHSYSPAVTKEPTEADTGIRTYTCPRCGTSYTEAIAKLPASHKHSYVSAVSKEATCTDKGVKTYSCSCGDTYTEEISALGHSMSNGKCTRCGYTASDSSTSGSSSGTSGSSSFAATGSSLSAAAGASAAGTAGTGTAGTGLQSTAGAASSGKGGKGSEKNVTVSMKENTVLYEETIASIRGKEVEVVLDMGNNVSWTIDGSNIVYDEANGIDMGVTLDSGSIPGPVLERFKGNPAYTVIELTLAHSGSLDFKPVLTVNTAKENAGRIGNLFFYNPEKEELEFVDSVTITEDGGISFTLTHASDYALIISDESMDDTVISGEAVTDGDDTAAVTGKDTQQAESPRETESTPSPTVIVIIAVIVILTAAIGITIYLLLSKKEMEEYAETADDETQDREIEEVFMQTSAPTKKESGKKYLDDDTGDLSDDYHEPAVSRKAGRVTSVKKPEIKAANPAGKNKKIGSDAFDKDDFDGFE